MFISSYAKPRGVWRGEKLLKLCLAVNYQLFWNVSEAGRPSLLSVRSWSSQAPDAAAAAAAAVIRRGAETLGAERIAPQAPPQRARMQRAHYPSSLSRTELMIGQVKTCRVK